MLMLLVGVSGSVAQADEIAFTLAEGTNTLGSRGNDPGNFTLGKFISGSYVLSPLAKDSPFFSHSLLEGQLGLMTSTNFFDPDSHTTAMLAVYFGLQATTGDFIFRLEQGVSAFSDSKNDRAPDIIQLPTKGSAAIASGDMSLSAGYTHFSNGSAGRGLDYITLEVRYAIFK